MNLPQLSADENDPLGLSECPLKVYMLVLPVWIPLNLLVFMSNFYKIVNIL